VFVTRAGTADGNINDASVASPAFIQPQNLCYCDALKQPLPDLNVALPDPDTIMPDTDDSPNTQRAKALKNQFNFSERASQTFNNPSRSVDLLSRKQAR
jgi:hypothetical protein